MVSSMETSFQVPSSCATLGAGVAVCAIEAATSKIGIRRDFIRQCLFPVEVQRTQRINFRIQLALRRSTDPNDQKSAVRQRNHNGGVIVRAVIGLPQIEAPYRIDRKST